MTLIEDGVLIEVLLTIVDQLAQTVKAAGAVESFLEPWTVLIPHKSLSQRPVIASQPFQLLAREFIPDAKQQSTATSYSYYSRFFAANGATVHHQQARLDQ